MRFVAGRNAWCVSVGLLTIFLDDSLFYCHVWVFYWFSLVWCIDDPNDN